MKLSAIEVKDRIEILRKSLPFALSRVSVEYGYQGGDTQSDDDWAVWVNGYGITPSLIAVDTLVGKRYYNGYTVLRVHTPDASPMDSAYPPEPIVDEAESYKTADGAVAYMVACAIQEWGLRRLTQTEEQAMLDELPGFLKRQAD